MSTGFSLGLTASANVVAAASGIGAGGAASYSLSNLSWSGDAYQHLKLNYAGDDSSGQPVWFVAMKSNGNHEGMLIKHNNDSTITQSAVKVLRNSDERFSCIGAVGYDTSGNLIAVSNGVWRSGGVIKADLYVNAIDLDNCTLGTTYGTSDWTAEQSNARLAYITYAGNGRFIPGFRRTGIKTAVATVGTSSVSFSSEQQHSTNIGDGVYQGVEAFPYQSDTDYRYTYFNGNGNQQGVGWFATNTPQGEDSDDVLTVGLTQTYAYPLSATSYLTVATKTGTAKMTGATVSWPASGAPTQTVGSETAFTDSSSWNGAWAGGVDLGTSTFYALHDDTTHGWNIAPITLSGTTPSNGTRIDVEQDVTTTNWHIGYMSQNSPIANSTQGKLFSAVIDDTGSSAPLFFIKELS